jgi:hypothetical protein
MARAKSAKPGRIEGIPGEGILAEGWGVLGGSDDCGESNDGYVPPV